MSTMSQKLWITGVNNGLRFGRVVAGDWMAEEQGIQVIEGKQGPDVPDDFNPSGLEPVGFLHDSEVQICGTEAQKRAVNELGAL